MTAALFFAPDAYVLDGNQIMGRRVAGAVFLRAVVEGRGDDPVVGYSIGQQNMDSFRQAVRSIDPAAPTEWIRTGRHDLLAERGTLHRADPAICAEARLRLRTGSASFSLTGVTHTLSTSGTLDLIASYLSEPVMPWDALICTSAVAVDVVRATFDEAAAYLRWRFGGDLRLTLPQLPVIPLGVHGADWAVSDAARQAARQRLVIAEDEVAVLFSGRLSYAAKAHPFQMFEALRAAADRSDRPVRLLLAGQFFNKGIGEDFLSTARTYCPNVRCQHVDGEDAGLYAAAYAGADIFLSLADNIQETFGITPVEAMAAGLPVVVSDWNGYRDTVRDGIDGFRIPSRAPAPGAGDNVAHGYEILGNYDVYSSRTSTTVSVDMAVLVERLVTLIGDPELRRRMGAAGRQRVATEFDWRVIYPRYRELWEELGRIRTHQSAQAETAAWLASAPHAHHAHDDPFRRFASYPTRFLSTDTVLGAAPGAGRAAYEALTGRPIFAPWRIAPDLAERIIAAAGKGPASIADIARQVGLAPEAAIEPIARLVKMNLLLPEED
ncbi:glycosyltransferase family 4 protein [Rhizorhabdus dicambivorans]|uniref:Glycosyl transferase family 1 n=1 Tax=Rhizorhabdus dicambivorans TaxID=1850238 RepID=A0A2A4FTR7_9SPHN|nr:glycosyltransferase family 4 protein [Rhizorhabdus dicambivorans]ATE66426.1 glycosyl transferase family 1 [Rhizorhabdus dicambivorans]PCE41082.1 glycosyl transferase family 1 [Rhizorhabdus dicambivorans]